MARQWQRHRRLAQDINKTTLQERLAQQVKNDEPLTYSDPKIKRTGGL